MAPAPQFLAVAGVLHLAAGAAAGCADEMDCSLNGACKAGACACDPGYIGAHCERLNEGRTHLLWPPQAGMPWSAGWGASVRQEPGGGQWHAWVDVICQANQTGPALPARYVTCYHTQGTNVVHLTAAAATGPYAFADVSLGAETNNPHTVVRPVPGPDQYLLFHTNDNKPRPDIATCTGVPGGAPFRNQSNRQPCIGCSAQGSIGVATAASPAGPWKTVFPFVGKAVPGNQGSLANPSPLLLANGSLMLAYRYSDGVKHKASEAIAIAIADSAEGPWEFLQTDVTALNVEDPALYANKRGYHLALHQYNATFVEPNGTVVKLQYGDPRMASGAHAFSKDGRTWATSPYAIYNNSITWANGSSVVLNYRERPELVTDADGAPRYLVTGAEWGIKCAFPTCVAGQSCQSIAMITEILH
jgi:hypothetical protein